MKKSVLLFALCVYIFAGCTKEPQKALDQEECQVEVSFSNDFTKSLLKSTTDEEKTLSKVVLFGVDAAGDYVAKYTIASPVVGAQPLTILKKIKTLYAIANPTNTMEALTPDKTELDALVGDFSSAPATPLLMGGSGDIVNNEGVYWVVITLSRAMAKVVFTSEGFTITSVKATNTPDQAYVFKQPSVAAPSTATLIDTYAGVAGTDADPVYVAENANAADETATKFAVSGKLDNNKTVTYNITLKSGPSTFLPIERNKQYNVTVKVTDTSCTVTITMPDWDDVNGGEYEIPYDDFVEE
ncbi:MAG: hypothetical protein LBL24_01940 [Bacteroidales bacterium]|jgi:hypothetical protein|nr:hypothetical protein [Bacteroidales bacterium]